MVQIINMPQNQIKPPSIANRISEGLGQGIANTANTYMSAQIQDMFDAKKEARKQSQSIQLAHQLTKNYAQGDKDVYEEILPVVAELAKTSPDAAIKYLKGLSPESINKMRDQRKEYEQDKVNKENGIYPQAKADRPPMVMQGNAGEGWNKAQGSQTSPGQMNMAPVVMPGRQGTSSDPRAIKGATNQTYNGSQNPQNPQEPQGKYRWTKNLQGKPIQIVNQLADAETEAEARAYIDQMYGPSDRKSVYAEWQKDRANKIAEQSVGIKKDALSIKLAKDVRDAEDHKKKQEENPRLYITAMNNQKKKATDNLIATRSMRELNKKGEVKNTINRITSWLGVPEDAFKNPTEEVMAKLSNTLMPGLVSQYQGQGQVFKSEVNSIAATIPSLLQTQEGRGRLIEYQGGLAELSILEANTSEQLRKEYKERGETLPEDFQQEVLDRAEPMAKALKEKLHQIMSPGAPTLESMEDKCDVKLEDGTVVTIDTINLPKMLAIPGVQLTW